MALVTASLTSRVTGLVHGTSATLLPRPTDRVVFTVLPQYWTNVAATFFLAFLPEFVHGSTRVSRINR